MLVAPPGPAVGTVLLGRPLDLIDERVELLWLLGIVLLQDAAELAIDSLEIDVCPFDDLIAPGRAFIDIGKLLGGETLVAWLCLPLAQPRRGAAEVPASFALWNFFTGDVGAPSPTATRREAGSAAPRHLTHGARARPMVRARAHHFLNPTPSVRWMGRGPVPAPEALASSSGA
jgi:hypothetical protein